MPSNKKPNQFKENIRNQANQKKDVIDETTAAFERALREKNKYVNELKRNGYREIKGTGRGR